MFPDAPISAEKDKRMLVLLAFGTLVILARICMVSLADEALDTRWIWSEGSVQGTGLQRSTLEITSSQGRTPRVKVAGNRLIASVDKEKNLSPRAAFLLMLPFQINSASLVELEMLPGIGPKLAAGIDTYRTRYGPVSDKRTFMKVPGIGPKLAARLTPLLSFEEK